VGVVGLKLGDWLLAVGPEAGDVKNGLDACETRLGRGKLEDVYGLKGGGDIVPFAFPVLDVDRIETCRDRGKLWSWVLPTLIRAGVSDTARFRGSSTVVCRGSALEADRLMDRKEVETGSRDTEEILLTTDGATLLTTEAASSVSRIWLWSSSHASARCVTVTRASSLGEIDCAESIAVVIPPMA
jgi:hypothetical protein